MNTNISQYDDFFGDEPYQLEEERNQQEGYDMEHEEDYKNARVYKNAND